MFHYQTLCKKVLEQHSPKMLLRLRLATKRGYEPEMKLLHQLCTQDKSSIDVGANVGIYTYYMQRFSKAVYAFEPNGELAQRLKIVFCDKNVVVEPVALSDRDGSARLRVPQYSDGLATIEVENRLSCPGDIEVMEVPTRTLDSYAFTDIGCIKIDVEGHELAVLCGAKKLLERERPALIIECEERHKPGTLTEVDAFLKNFGYQGFFYRENKLHSVAGINPSSCQNIHHINKRFARSAYLNNFIFLNDKHESIKLRYL